MDAQIRCVAAHRLRARESAVRSDVAVNQKSLAHKMPVLGQPLGVRTDGSWLVKSATVAPPEGRCAVLRG